MGRDQKKPCHTNSVVVTPAPVPTNNVALTPAPVHTNSVAVTSAAVQVLTQLSLVPSFTSVVSYTVNFSLARICLAPCIYLALCI